MDIDETLRELATEAEPKIAALLRRAYELGYREGLASRPAQNEAESRPAPEGAESDGGDEALDLEGVEDPFMPDDSERSGLFDFSGELSPDEVAGGNAEASASGTNGRASLQDMLPLIRSSARVATLMERIHHYFALDRFDVDIVVFRKGDGSRRQLRREVRLSRYAVGE